MKLIDGKKIAKNIEAEFKLNVEALKQKGIVPCLGIIVFDDDRGGQVYTRLKTEAAERIGIKIVKSNSDSVLESWDRDDSVHGILIQRPGYRGEVFEKYWDELVLKIAPEKDVDGLRPDSKFIPATVLAVEKTLKHTLSAYGRKRLAYIVIGKGVIGRAMAKRFNAKNISSRDPDLVKESLQADVLISACGRQGIIKEVKPGAFVIDVGWPKGDVDFDRVKKTAGAITPVPGGVGPVTVACLLENLLLAVYNRL